MKEGQSKLEQRMINKGESAFDKFVSESTQDAEMDKMLDSLIDERMGAGKTDEQILAELASMTNMTSEADSMSNEQSQSRHDDLVQQLEESLGPEERQKAFDLLGTAEFGGDKGFDEFTERHSEMRYDEDNIIEQ